MVEQNNTKLLKVKGRTFFFSSDEKHLKLEKIKEALTHSTIKKYAYILHDRDTYTEADLTNQQDKIEKCKSQGKEYKGKILTKNDIGKKKPNHYHIVLSCPNKIELITIANWFGLQPFMIDIAVGKKGQNAFIDCCRYLTHEELKQRELGKQVYRYDEVISSTNFDFAKEMKKINQFRDDFGEDIDKTQAYYRYVSEGMKTLDEIHDEDIDFYNSHLTTLEKLRNDYMLKRATLPKVRINYYIQGNTGLGKSELAKALARSLSPSFNDRYSFFKAIKGKFPFEKYEGQNVIIWDDFRPYDLKQACKGKTGFFNIFDVPDNQGVDIKNNATRLLNKYNIITGVMPYDEFLDKIASAFGDDDNEDERLQKGQAYRRVPIIINLHKEDFDILLNRGWLDENSNFEEYTTIQKVRGSMKRIAELCGGNTNLKKQLQHKIVSPILIETKKLDDKRTKDNQNESEVNKILEETKDYGSTIDMVALKNEYKRLSKKNKDSILDKTEKERLKELKTKYNFDDEEDLPF